MTAAITAVVATTAISAGMQYNNAKKQAKAQKQASREQARANDKNIAYQERIFKQQRADQQPWRLAGQDALKQLQAGIKSGAFDGGKFKFDFSESPDYQFRKQEGINALDASASARGKLLSGSQVKNVERFGSNLASQEYGNAFNRALAEYGANQGQRDNKYNKLASLAGVGQTANQAIGQARQQLGSSVGGSLINTGNALAQGSIGAGNAKAQGYQGMAQSFNQGVSNYLTYDMYKNMMDY